MAGASEKLLSYDRAWNQLNRNQGVLAAFIPAYTLATGDRRPLDLLAEAAGYKIVSIQSKEKQAPLEKQLIELSIDCGRTQELIEKAYEDRRITCQEYRRIHSLLNQFIDLILNLDEKLKSEAI